MNGIFPESFGYFALCADAVPALFTLPQTRACVARLRFGGQSQSPGGQTANAQKDRRRYARVFERRARGRELDELQVFVGDELFRSLLFAFRSVRSVRGEMRGEDDWTPSW